MFQLKTYIVQALVILAIGSQAALDVNAQTGDRSTSDATTKEAILNSSRWKEMESEFHQWLSTQVVYTPTQADQLKARLEAEIDKMSAKELKEFLDQWEAKLKILLGQDAEEAQQWLGQFLSVAADGYRKQVFERLGITDLASMTAAQLEDVVQNIRAQELQFRANRTVFDQARADSVQTAQRFQSERQKALTRAGTSRAPQFDKYQSHMAPKRYDWRPRAPLIPWGGWW